MQKGFTLAETLITMTVIGIIMALSIPAVIQSTNDSKPLFKKAYLITEQIVSDLVNDTALYPTGDLSAPASGTFCSNLFAKLNTIGFVSATTCPNTFTSVLPASRGVAGTPVATLTNGIQWYGDASPNNFVFTGANCTTAGITGNCAKIQVDVNGYAKGANLNTSGDAHRDIYSIYVSNAGQVTVVSGSDEAVLLQN